MARAFSRAWAKTGNRMAARIAMMAMTTRSSIRVKPLDRLRWDDLVRPLDLLNFFLLAMTDDCPFGDCRHCIQRAGNLSNNMTRSAG